MAGVLPILVAAALAGCGQAGDDTLGSPAPQGATTATADPGSQPTTPQPSPAPAPSPDDGADGTGTGAGAGGSARATTPGASGGAADGAGGTADGAAPSEQDATPAIPTAPKAAASPVFVGEPCVPELDTAPAVAINGLTLYCAPPTAGATGPGSWSNVSPQQHQQGPAPGSECDSSDQGQVQQGPSGRPVACLREPNGEFRWADIS